MKFRILTHDCLTVTRQEIETYWCLDDVLEAHDVLDEIDNARHRAMAKR